MTVNLEVGRAALLRRHDPAERQLCPTISFALFARHLF
jgi:hypothetical protein